MRRHAIILALLAGCASHENCGDNGAIAYAHFLDSRVDCWDLRRGHDSVADYALCRSGSEEWLCTGEGWCRPLGEPVKVVRVK